MNFYVIESRSQIVATVRYAAVAWRNCYAYVQYELQHDLRCCVPILRVCGGFSIATIRQITDDDGRLLDKIFHLANKLKS